MRVQTLVAILIALAATGTAAPQSQKQPNAFRTISDTLIRDSSMRQSTIGFTSAGLMPTLKEPGPWTVFVPNDGAYGKLTMDAARKMADSGERALQSYSYHVVRGKLLAADIEKLQTLDTMQGRPLSVQSENGQVTINGNAHFVKADILCKNGVIHILDEVLMPPRKNKILPPPPFTDSVFFRTVVFLAVSGAVAWLVFKMSESRKHRPKRVPKYMADD